jgi:hypothetical protein
LLDTFLTITDLERIFSLAKDAPTPRRVQGVTEDAVIQFVRSVRRIVLHFPRPHPDAATWTRLARALGAASA